MISDHFSVEEVNVTGTGLPNDCPQDYAMNAVRLANQVLEPLRVILGPLHINSWYRSPEVNKACGGEGHSAHLEARAADILPTGYTFDKFKMALTLLKDLPIDQIIFEKRNTMWIHVSIPKFGEDPRQQALVAHMGPNGKMIYQPYRES